MELDHEIISRCILLLPLIKEGLLSVSYKQKYVHEVLFYCLVKQAHEKVLLDELTVAVDWDLKSQTNQTIDQGIHCLIF